MKPYKAIGFCFVLSISFRCAERYCRCHLFSLRLPCPRRQTPLCTTLFPYGYPGFARVCAAVQKNTSRIKTIPPESKQYLPNQNYNSRIRTTILESELQFSNQNNSSRKNTKHFHKTIKHIKKRSRERVLRKNHEAAKSKCHIVVSYPDGIAPICLRKSKQ